MSEEYGDEPKEAQEMTSLERASRGAIGGGIGGGIRTGGGRHGAMGRIEKAPGEPEGPFRLWQRAMNDELAALQKVIEDLEGQLTPYLMPQTETEATPKDQAPAPQSELVAWVESSAMVVKLMRAHVSRLTQRLEL